ncbi:unnamed protein product [Discula destructiva]
MASSDQDVEQLLASKTPTPISQLDPDLADQATRKIHGEVTVTWPYSSVTKSFAFLLAEPDFRLRRNRGLVRIQLSGPSAEAVGQWELGSGDEVALTLDGVEWAKDEEPARAAGSRCDWQLKFAGKLTLKATFGETQGNKLLGIDQPLPIAAPEAVNPITSAEIDLTLLDHDLSFERAPAPTPAPAAPATTATGSEFTSPIFMKRSRASYGPLFDLEELEEDSGRHSKRHKGLHYAAVNGRWTVQVGSQSPEPEPVEDRPAAAQEKNGDVEMHGTSAKHETTDGEVQTRRHDLPPSPASPIDTPSKIRSNPVSMDVTDKFENSDASTQLKAEKPPQSLAGSPMASGVGVSRPPDNNRAETTISASPSKTAIQTPTELDENAPTQAAPNPFAQAFKPSNFTGFGTSISGLGAPSEAPSEHLETAPTEAAPNPFNQAPVTSGFTGFGQPQGPSQNQGFGHGSSLFGLNSTTPSNAAFAQSSSLFGATSAPAHSPFVQPSNLTGGFGAPSGSVRFGFGQSAQSTFSASPFGPPQASTQLSSADPYPESSLNPPQVPDFATNTSHNPSSTTTEEPLYGYEFEGHVEHEARNAHTGEQEVSLWPMGTQHFDAIHAVGRINATEDLRSDGSLSEKTPPGMIPPAVDDGTRNVDEMRQEGILSRPVFRQGVPQEALPDQEDASAGEDGASVDSEERADYNEAEIGDDYDLRNYERVSDDEEGLEHEQEPLSDDELLGDGSEHWAGAASGYATPGWRRGEGEEDEEFDYDEDEEVDYEEYDEDEEDVAAEQPGYAPQTQFLPQPPVQGKPIVIDLISDSEDDDPPPPPPVQTPRNQVVKQEATGSSQHEVADFSKNESDDDDDEEEQEVDLSRTPVPHDAQPHSLGALPEATDLGEGATGSEDDGESSEESGGEEESAEEEEPESGAQDLSRVTISREPGYDLVESNSDKEEEAQVQEAIMVNNAQLDGADNSSAVDHEQEYQLAEKEGNEEGQTEAQNDDAVNNAQLHGSDDAMAVDVAPQPDHPTESEVNSESQAELSDTALVDKSQLDGNDDAVATDEEQEIDAADSEGDQEDQAEPQDVNVAKTAQPNSADDVVAIDEEQQRGATESEGDKEDQAITQDPVAVSLSQVNVVGNTVEAEKVVETMILDEEPQGNLVGSFQSQPDNMLASFQSSFTATTNFSQASQDDNPSDIDMKDDLAQRNPQSVALENMAAEQDLGKDWSEQQKTSDELSQEITEDDSMNSEAGEGSVILQKTWTVEMSLDDEQYVPMSSPTIPHPTEAQVNDQRDVIRGHIDTEVKSDPASSLPLDEEPNGQQRIASEIQQRDQEAEPILSSPVKMAETHNGTIESTDVDMAGAAADETEDDAQQAGSPQPPLDRDVKSDSEGPDLKSSEVVPKAPEDEKDPVRSVQENVKEVSDDTVDEKQRLFAQTDGSFSDGGEDFHDAPTMPAPAVSSPASRQEDSFASVDSHVNEAQEPEEVGTNSLDVPKRRGRIARSASAKSASSAAAAKKGQRQASRQSSRQVPAQQPISSQRTTRSKTMSFQAAGPKENKKDMSIQAARAALKPPISKKVSTTKPKNTHIDLMKRLGKAMPNALPLKDLRKYINPPPSKTRPDFAAVVTSASMEPMRTQIREYTSVFTVTDPSLGAKSVVQVELFNKHKEFFPIVKVGDSILLRNFKGSSLRERGFGLTSRTATGSSWAVFEAGGGDDAQMKTPVETNAKEKKFMLDLRSWYAELDEAAKGKLGEAAGAIEEAHKESQTKK